MEMKMVVFWMNPSLSKPRKMFPASDHTETLRCECCCVEPPPRRGFLDWPLDFRPWEVRSREQGQDCRDDLHALRRGAQKLHWEEICADGSQDGPGGIVTAVQFTHLWGNSREIECEKQRPDTLCHRRSTLVENIKTMTMSHHLL